MTCAIAFDSHSLHGIIPSSLIINFNRISSSEDAYYLNASSSQDAFEHLCNDKWMINNCSYFILLYSPNKESLFKNKNVMVIRFANEKGEFINNGAIDVKSRAVGQCSQLSCLNLTSQFSESWIIRNVTTTSPINITPTGPVQTDCPRPAVIPAASQLSFTSYPMLALYAFIALGAGYFFIERRKSMQIT